jgi:hypothetical protein
MAPGVPAYSGFYTVTLSVVPLGGTSAVNLPVTFDNGQAIDRYCGTPTFRDYACEGGGGFLSVGTAAATAGQGSWVTWTPITNSLSFTGVVDNWPLGTSGTGVFSALVPFGDLNGDRFNDLLARDGSGQLWFCPGTGSPGFSSQPRTLLGSGWNTYNLLISTGDYRPDLLARNASGQLYRYNGTATGKLAAKVLVSSVIGVGDMNGDGLNDILGRNSAGALILYASTAQGTFTSGHQVSTGWTGVNLY